MGNTKKNTTSVTANAAVPLPVDMSSDTTRD